MRDTLLFVASMVFLLLSVWLNNQTFMKSREIVKLRDEKDYWLSKYYEMQAKYVSEVSIVRLWKKLHGSEESGQPEDR